jgi:hypothetical protein
VRPELTGKTGSIFELQIKSDILNIAFGMNGHSFGLQKYPVPDQFLARPARYFPADPVEFPVFLLKLSKTSHCGLV